MNKIIMILIIGIVFTGCGRAGIKNSELDGIWETEGYGYVFEIENNLIISLYDSTSISLIEQDSEYLNEYFDVALQNNGKLVISNFNTTYTAVRKGSLPVFDNEPEAADPLYNFDVLWNSFNEQYAFMKHKNIDWNNQYTRYRALINESTTDYDLFNYMTEMLEPLADSHVNLIVPDVKWWSNPSGDIDNYLKNTFVSDLLSVSKEYLIDGNEFRKTANDLILYGKMKGHSGYICIMASQGFSGGSFDDEMSVLENSLNEIIEYLEGCNAIVVDNRFNQGGYDETMQTVASRFAGKRTLAYTKKARNKDSYTEEIPKYIDPEGKSTFNNKYTKVLTSPITVSAGEVLVLAMRSLPNTEVIGMSTSGSLSDLLYKELPNGWEFTLSNEVYISHDNISFENKGVIGEGIMPDRFVDINIDGFLKDNIDSILSAAIDQAD